MPELRTSSGVPLLVPEDMAILRTDRGAMALLTDFSERESIVNSSYSPGVFAASPHHSSTP